MKRIASRLTFANVMASIAIFLTLGGTALAVKQVSRNSVNSASIKNGSVTGKDVKNDTITGTDVDESTLIVPPIGPDAVGSAEVADRSLRGTDIADASISGPEINEQGLSRVPSASTAVQGGLGRYGFDGECNPASATLQPCVVRQIGLGEPARLLITGTAEGIPEVNKLAAMGRCQIGTTSGPIEASSIFVPVMAEDQDYPPGQRAVQRTLTAVSGVFPAGNHAVGIDCADLSAGGGGISYPQVRLTVVALSAE